MKFTVIIGEEEVAAKTAILRDMSSARQETLPADRLKDRLKSG
jgi:histidyl-tRNA synthetase